MVYKWIIASYAAFIAISYLSIVDFTNVIPTLAALALFVTLVLLPDGGPIRRGIRIASLLLLHWFINDWWILFLYFLVLGREYYLSHNLTRLRVIGLVYYTMFAAISIPQAMKIHIYANLGYAAVFTLLFIVFGHIMLELIVSRMRLADKLQREHSALLGKDPLTGLTNFEESHRILEKLVAAPEPLLLVLIDCADLKSMNTSRGYRTGNLILKQIADLLVISFADAKLIARYGGDEFALVLPLQDSEPVYEHTRQLLDSELPKLTGIRMTYGMASYPGDARTKDSLLGEAENRLYMKKRELWLEREEHLLRSEKLRVVGELASGMAHEIRNPLTAVRGFLQISKSNGYNIEAWYSLIMEEIDRMSELTAEFLQFSKPQSTDFRAHSLQTCLQRVIALTESEASRLGLKLVYEHPQAPLLLWMDPDKMVQLLLNLVKNAYEAMNPGGVLYIRMKEISNRAVVEIQDTGVGIPSDRLETIFHPFYTTKDYGTGLGLSISYKIVQDHEGTLEVESIVGEGTTFVLTFPVLTAAEETG
ncbi:ATP-binding protein [Paenibacillus chartarius]|uniref:histidine kinase n=1 Tax=Paenibacillus chartarius TaxID=747481 RepID=A0ABV6DKM2_9BACL